MCTRQILFFNHSWRNTWTADRENREWYKGDWKTVPYIDNHNYGSIMEWDSRDDDLHRITMKTVNGVIVLNTNDIRDFRYLIKDGYKFVLDKTSGLPNGNGTKINEQRGVNRYEWDFWSTFFMPLDPLRYLEERISEAEKTVAKKPDLADEVKLLAVYKELAKKITEENPIFIINGNY